MHWDNGCGGRRSNVIQFNTEDRDYEKYLGLLGGVQTKGTKEEISRLEKLYSHFPATTGGSNIHNTPNKPGGKK